MSHLTDLAVHALPIARTACILTATTCQILLARLNTPAGTRHNTPEPTEHEAAPAAPAPLTAPWRTRLSRALPAALRTARGAAAILAALSWLHQVGAL